MKRYLFFLEPQDVDIIDKAAEKLGVKRSWFVRAAANSYAKKVLDSDKYQAVNVLSTGTREMDFIKEI